MTVASGSGLRPVDTGAPMSRQSNDLLTALRDLRRSVVVEAAPRIERWQADIQQPSFAASAANLAHYLTFRHHELRGLQQELMRHGLSSLGRLEGRVLVTLKTVETALEALLSGRPPPSSDWPASREELLSGRNAIAGEYAGPPGWIARYRDWPHPGDPADRGGAGTGLHAGDRAARGGRRCGSTARMTIPMHGAR